MASVRDAAETINDAFRVADDYQRAAAELTDAFSSTGYNDTDVEIPISQISNDPVVIDYLRRYDTDGNGHINRSEYNKAMLGLTDRTNNIAAVSGMLADTVEKIAEALLAVAKYF